MISHPWLFAVFFLVINILPVLPAQVTFTDLGASYVFGDRALFKVSITSTDPIRDVFLFLQPEGQNSLVEKMPLPGEVDISYEYDLRQKPWPPFAKITYWYQVDLVNGSQEESDRKVFSYDDNNFTWQYLEQDGYQVNWVQGDLVFGQTALNTVKNGVNSAQKYLPGNIPPVIKVYIYPSPESLQITLQTSQVPWMAGQAIPKLGIVMVSISSGPEQRMEMDRQIPHEIMHLVEYQAAGTSYSYLPTWLTEGVASLNEIYPNSDFQRSLENAVETGNLIPINLLCNGFSHEAASAFLSYAESTSFVRFLSEHFGSSGLQTLFLKYADGLDCNEGLLAAYGLSIDQLDKQWRQEILGINSQATSWKNLSPFLLLSLLLLLPPLLIIFSKRTKS